MHSPIRLGKDYRYLRYLEKAGPIVGSDNEQIILTNCLAF